MKQLLLIMAIIVCLFSCAKTSIVTQDKKLSIEVAKLVKNNQFDTLLIINTEDKIYVFERGEYKNTINKFKDENTAGIAGILIGILLMVIFATIGIILGAFD